MIISIAHQKGGVGKSTLAFNLAYYLSKYKPLLLDLDIQNTISYANSIREQNANNTISLIILIIYKLNFFTHFR